MKIRHSLKSAKAASTSSTRPTRASRPARAKRRSRLCDPGGGGHRLPPLFYLAYERGMQMPPLDPAILARRSEIVAALRAIVSGEGVIDDLDGMRPYECDALSAYRHMPLVVVLPETVVQVSAILRYCQDNKVK